MTHLSIPPCATPSQMPHCPGPFRTTQPDIGVVYFHVFIPFTDLPGNPRLLGP